MMTQIDINKHLFEKLQNDFRNTESQIKFFNGLDYLEAMVKFFACLNIAVVRVTNEKIYNDIFIKNFKLAPSLGDFKSLATACFTKANAKELKSNELFVVLEKLFTTNDLVAIKLVMASDILDDNKKPKPFKNLLSLFDEYIVNFRNKLKGHGASFSADDSEQSKLILENLALLIKSLEQKIETLLNTDKLAFYTLNNENIQGHRAQKVIAEYNDIQYELSPLMIYLECDRYSCKHHHKVKLFFYNDSKSSKSYYIDYGYNHYYFFSENNEVEYALKEIQRLQQKINAHSSSDDSRLNNLLSVFVGREDELKNAKEHIMQGIKNFKPTAITIKGKPGTGKSAFVSKLQTEIKDEYKDDTKKLNSYVFYARKSEMSDDENKFFYNKLYGYISNLGIAIKKLENDQDATIAEKLENIFQEIGKDSKNIFLFIVDGLDEFSNPISFLQNLPLSNIPNNIHFVFSTRGYKDILDMLQQKLFDSSIDVLNTKDYPIQSSSISLGGLKQNEVAELINQVLTKDIQRNSTEYITIQEEIYDKSEGLPLYIHYICEKLIEFDPQNSDISKEILEYSKKLPKGLDNFYYQVFEQLDTISSTILYILFFAHKGLSFKSFYTSILSLIKKTDLELDEKEFQSKYFSKVEIFLSKNEDEKYSFYHLSVKEAIKAYFSKESDIKSIYEIDLDTFAQDVPVSKDEIPQYKSTFENMYYIDKNSILFKTLLSLVETLNQDKLEDKYKAIYKDNFLNYYKTFIWFNIIQESITIDDIKAKQYQSFMNYKISDNIKQEINNFFKHYDKSDKIDIAEIKYAHELAMITDDYYRILTTSKDYKEAFNNIFIDILWNLDNPINKKLFKSYKYIWQDMYDDDMKKLFLSNPRILSYTNEALEIAKSIKSDRYKSEALASIAQKHNDKELLSQALEIVHSIKNDLGKSQALVSIVEKANDIELALEIAQSIENNYDKSKALVSIAQKTDNIDLALEIAKNLENSIRQSIVLASIAQKTDDIALALEIAKSIKSDKYKSEALASIAQKNKDKELLSQAFEIAQNIEDSYDKSKALASIAQKTNDKELLSQALEIVHSTKNDLGKSQALVSIVEKANDIELALEIAKSIKSDEYKSEALASIAQKTNDKELFCQALEIIQSIENDKYKLEVLVSIAQKTYNIDLALEIAKNIEDSIRQSIVLVSIIKKIDDIALALEVAQRIKVTQYKSQALSYIAQKTDNIALALKITKNIKDNSGKSQILASIAQKTDNIALALKITKNIRITLYKSQALSSIAEKTDDQELFKQALEIARSIRCSDEKSEALASIVEKTDNMALALEIAQSIEDYYYKSQALSYIAQKIGDKELLSQALKIAQSIEDNSLKLHNYLSNNSKALSSIAKKTNNIELALEIAQSIENNSYKSSTLVSIVEKTDNMVLALEIAQSIEDDWYKSKALASIAQKTNDIVLALEIAQSIEDDWYKSKALVSIALRTDDKELLIKVFKIAQSIINFNTKENLLFNLKQSKCDFSKYLKNMMYTINKIKEFQIVNSNEYVQIHDKDGYGLLRFYGFNITNNNNKFKSIVEFFKRFYYILMKFDYRIWGIK